MKKDDFIKGLDEIDDELIAEAASARSRGISYKTRTRLIRFFMGTAAAAVMITTGVLLHINRNKTPEPERFTGAAATETASKDRETITEAVTSSDTNAAAVTTIPFDGNEFFTPMENYSNENDSDVVNVQYNIARNYGTWINCTKEQADTILEKLGDITRYDAEPALGIYCFTADVFNINVEFYDGSHTIFTIPGGTVYESRENDVEYTQFELKDGSTEELYRYLLDEYTKVQPYIDENLAKTDTTTTTVTTHIEYVIPAKTTTRTDTADEPAVTTVPAADNERELVYTGDFYFPMKNYTYAGNENIVNVKFSNSQLLNAHNAWINCSHSQADRILNYISNFNPKTEPVYEFTGGGFCVLVEYADGTSDKYEVMGTDSAYFVLDDSNKRYMMYIDTAGFADELTLYLQGEYMKIADFIDSIFTPIYG